MADPDDSAPGELPPPLPPPPPAGAPVQPSTFESIRQPLVERQQQLLKQGEALAGQKAQETAPYEEAVIAETQKPLPPRPQPAALPPTPNNLPAPMFTTSPGPHGEPVKPSKVLQNFMAAMTEFASALGGVATRHPAPMASLAAISGATEGWLQGDAIRRKSQMEQWDKETKRALALHAEQQEDYANVLTERRLGLEGKLEALKVKTQKWDDQIMFNLAQQKNVDGILKELDNREARYQQLLATRERTFYLAQSAEQKNAIMQQIAEQKAEHDRMWAEMLREQRAAADPLNKPVLDKAAHLVNAQGQHPKETDTWRQIVAGGYHSYQGKEPKEVTIPITLASIDQIIAMIPNLRAKGLLMNQPGGPAFLSTWFNRHVQKVGDPDLTAFEAHTSSLVRTARELGDIGFRAQVAISGTTNLIEKATTAEGLDNGLRQLRNLIEISAPSTMTRKLRAYNMHTNKVEDVILDPGDTLNRIPTYYDVNRTQ